MDIETDYLVVGAGASGLAFADSLLAEADVDVVIVDRRESPRRPLAERLPVRPAALAVGVLRRELDAARRRPADRVWPERRVLRAGQRTGDLRVLRERRGRPPRADRAGAVPRRPRPSRRRRRRAPGPRPQQRRRAHGAGATPASSTRPTWNRPSRPPTNPRSPSLRSVVRPHQRPARRSRTPTSASPSSDAGKTSADACLWLLDNGVTPDRIRWVRPRDMWFNDRAHLQPLDQVAQTMEASPATRRRPRKPAT